MAQVEPLVSTQTIYLEREEVLLLHAKVIAIPVSSVLENVRDNGLLDSALARPKNAFVYDDAGVMRQAATLLWGLVKNHPFRDGNRRTAYVVMEAFLRGNGLTVTSTDDMAFNIIVGVADGRFDVDEVETWINQTVDPWKPSK